MKPTLSLRAIRPGALTPPSPAMPRLTRCYASSNGLGTTAAPTQKRRSVTPFNDTGSVPWSELSSAEKAARATQQSFNFGLIMAGLVLTGGVGYLLWTEVFSPDGKISQFNRAVNKIKKDSRCIELLGDPKHIMAHGDENFSKWRRARPIASSERTDPQGNAHLVMRFHVDGSLQNGVAQLHLVKRRGESNYEYKYLFLDVKGHERIYLENAESKPKTGKKQLSFLGVKWG
ncbi:hypothetical protein G6O67_000690 [Ophiocordyceps sinensis]|uniref:Mitochondrial import inner membrane translocase subunit Tim21 n=2 Tax=Ophiocordyceps sinensis TaxID=72228 RepID=A0A8H4PZL6_9HYPO|nr:import inner membrane translocase subunit tim-21 [Ophiocordyceps sinensis CO18]KAF4513417.1 hypothetical protein G6O67_000690 [Ophiocordyceps sinensis]